MRVVLDTNILLSALIAPAGNPATIYNAWEWGKFTLLTCTEHLDELRATLQKPRVADLIQPYKADRLVNQIKKLAEHVGQLPHATTWCSGSRQRGCASVSARSSRTGCATHSAATAPCCTSLKSLAWTASAWTST